MEPKSGFTTSEFLNVALTGAVAALVNTGLVTFTEPNVQIAAQIITALWAAYTGVHYNQGRISLKTQAGRLDPDFDYANQLFAYFAERLRTSDRHESPTKDGSDGSGDAAVQ